MGKNDPAAVSGLADPNLVDAKRAHDSTTFPSRSAQRLPCTTAGAVTAAEDADLLLVVAEHM